MTLLYARKSGVPLCLDFPFSEVEYSCIMELPVYSVAAQSVLGYLSGTPDELAGGDAFCCRWSNRQYNSMCWFLILFFFVGCPSVVGRAERSRANSCRSIRFDNQLGRWILRDVFPFLRDDFDIFFSSWQLKISLNFLKKFSPQFFSLVWINVLDFSFSWLYNGSPFLFVVCSYFFLLPENGPTVLTRTDLSGGGSSISSTIKSFCGLCLSIGCLLGLLRPDISSLNLFTTSQCDSFISWMPSNLEYVTILSSILLERSMFTQTHRVFFCGSRSESEPRQTV